VLGIIVRSITSDEILHENLFINSIFYFTSFYRLNSKFKMIFKPKMFSLGSDEEC
jgi:hypothetical protein